MPNWEGAVSSMGRWYYAAETDEGSGVQIQRDVSGPLTDHVPHPGIGTLSYPSDGRLRGPQKWSGRHREEQNLTTPGLEL